MRAVVYREGKAHLEERPDPVPAAGQVLVRVHAAGLNRADLLQLKGGYPAPPGWPADIPGLEYAGEVVSLGPGTIGRRVGDRVMGLVGGGAHAQLVVVYADETLDIPPGLDWAAAAAIPEAFLTAFDALVERARVRPGERVLIHAAASGVGTAAIQVARLLGAVPVGTSRSADKLARLGPLGPLGLAEGILAGEGGFRGALARPVDVILDVLGGPALADNLAVLAPRGRLVLLGFLAGSRAEEVDLGPVLRGRLEVIGSVMRTRGREERVALAERFRRELAPAFAAGTLHPVVGATFSFNEPALAHEAMAANRTFGKVVLTW